MHIFATIINALAKNFACSLGKEEGDKVAQVHGLRGRPSPGVQEKRLVVLIRIQNTFKVTAKRKSSSSN